MIGRHVVMSAAALLNARCSRTPKFKGESASSRYRQHRSVCHSDLEQGVPHRPVGATQDCADLADERASPMLLLATGVWVGRPGCCSTERRLLAPVSNELPEPWADSDEATQSLVLIPTRRRIMMAQRRSSEPQVTVHCQAQDSAMRWHDNPEATHRLWHRRGTTFGQVG